METIQEIKARMTPEDLVEYETAGRAMQEVIVKTSSPIMCAKFVSDIGLGLIGAGNMGLIAFEDIPLIFEAVTAGILSANAVAMKYSLPDPKAN